MDREKLKDRVREKVRQHAPAAIVVAHDILDNPETGFREVRTAGLAAQWFASLGLPHRDKRSGILYADENDNLVWSTACGFEPC